MQILQNEHIRLAVLRLLSEQNDSAANAAILGDALKVLGLGTSRDNLLVQLAWLDEQSLVKLEQLDEGITVVKLRARGFDAATGTANIPGVSRPRLKD